ncbi:MAG: hypothetical protein PWQ63_1681 [Methanolobus sp.]|jgi:hypothetical protein|nr:hypothetical protein [Methanolobus sp.]
MENNSKKLILFVVSICVAVACIVAGGVLWIESQDQVSYETYMLNTQYIGDCNGYHDCLIMEVSPIFFSNENGSYSMYAVNDTMTLYYAEEHELYPAEAGDLINVRWLQNDIMNARRIDGIDVL